jgi:excisionase family DNA binding protein
LYNLATHNTVWLSQATMEGGDVGMSTQELLTAAQVGEVLHMRSDSIVRKIKRGEIPAVKIGKQWLIRKETLDAMLQSAPQGT